MINICPVLHNKEQCPDLPLPADEQESTIDRYPKRGEMLILTDAGNTKAAYVVTRETEDVFEIKNIAAHPQCRRQGCGRTLMEHLFKRYAGRCQIMLVGADDSPLTVPFYESHGFTYSHRIPDFFTGNYNHPIYEAGKQLKNTIYLERSMNE